MFTAVDRSLTDGSVPVPQAGDQSLFDFEVELHILRSILRRPVAAPSREGECPHKGTAVIVPLPLPLSVLPFTVPRLLSPTQAPSPR